MRFELAMVLSLALAGMPACAEVFERGKQLMMCHRTANRDAPENTLASLEETARLGCDIVELDIARTLDGKLVLLHDGPIDRISSGSGEVEKMLYREFRLYDSGAWMGPQFAGMQAPLFEDALRLSRKLGLKLVLDFKSSGIGREVLELVRAEGMLERVRFGGLWDDVRPLHAGANAQPTSLWTAGMTKGAVAALQSQGRFVIANFSANDHELDLWMMKDAVAAGVDVINVDYPRVASDALERPIEAKVARLVKKARGGDTEAIAELGHYRDFDLTPVLMELLDTRAAAVALVEARRSNSVEPLLRALADPQPQRAANAAWALGMMAASRALPALVSAASRRESSVASEVMLALSRIPGKVDAAAAIELRLTDADPLVAGTASLAAAKHCGERAPQMVERAAEHLRAGITRFSAEFKGSPGVKPPPDVLARSLALYRGYQKTVAARGMLGSRSALPETLRTAQDMTSIGSWVASYRLWEGGSATVPPLITALGAEDAGLRNRAKWTLIKLQGAGPALRGAFAAASGEQQLALAEILAWRGDYKALPALRSAADRDGVHAARYRWSIDKIASMPEDTVR